jgi:hypothetical protein
MFSSPDQIGMQAFSPAGNVFPYLFLDAGDGVSPTCNVFSFNVSGYYTRELVIQGDGNIGIGCVCNPAQKLAVDGNISASGDLYLEGGLRDSNNQLGAAGQILRSTGAGLNWINNTGGVTGSLSGSGLANKVAFFKDSEFVSASCNFHWDDVNEYLGIGTASPTQKLYVSGNAVVDGNINLETAGDCITFYGDCSGAHSITSRDCTGVVADDLRINSYASLIINLDSNNNNTANADFMIGRHGGTSTISDWLFTLDGETGNVGIGTTDPKQTLHVENSSAVQAQFNSLGSISNIIVGTGSYNDAFSRIQFKTTKTGGSGEVTSAIYQYGDIFSSNHLHIQSAQDIVFLSGSTEAVRIKDGNVGIGITSPAQKLHVAGSTLISNNNYHYGFTSGGAQATLIGIKSNNYVTVGQLNANNVGTDIYGGTGNIYLYSGSVNRLTVSSDVNVQGATDLNINGPSRRLSFTSGTGTIRTTTSNKLFLQTNSTDALTIDASQNVGIGTTNPSQKLTVTGKIDTVTAMGTAGGLIEVVVVGARSGFTNMSIVLLVQKDLL